MNVFNNLISDNEYFIHPYECIYDSQDYKAIIEKAIELTNGILELTKFSCKCNIEEFEYHLEINKKTVYIYAQIYSNYIDSHGLITGLNVILEEIGYDGNKHFCDLIGEVTEFGLAFITQEQELELARQRLISRKGY